jgi:type IV pilus assembly protein PilA
MTGPSATVEYQVMPHVRHEEDGFTLIELLVVIGIIGILAAIALPAFLGQTRGASDSKAKSDVATAYGAIETYWAQHDTYAATPADLVNIEGALTGALNLSVAGTPSTFVLMVESKQGSTFTITKDAQGNSAHTCLPVGVGGCDANGEW